MSIAVDCNHRVFRIIGPPRGVTERARVRVDPRWRVRGPANRADTQRVSSPSPDVARARFAAWVDRAIRRAQDRGLTTREIEARTGIGSSTWDRWRNRIGGMPKIDRVRAFAEGLDEDPQPAFAALGMAGVARTPTAPELDPDVRALARYLASPKVSDEEKLAIRLLLRRLAPQPDSARGGRREAG